MNYLQLKLKLQSMGFHHTSKFGADLNQILSLGVFAWTPSPDMTSPTKCDVVVSYLTDGLTRWDGQVGAKCCCEFVKFLIGKRFVFIFVPIVHTCGIRMRLTRFCPCSPILIEKL